MRISILLALSTTLLLSVTGCAAWATENDDGQREAVVIHVENRSYNQATVHVVNGVRQRLGEVPGNAERYFETRVPIGRELMFEIRMLAGSTHRTRGTAAIPGDTVFVQIPASVR